MMGQEKKMTTKLLSVLFVASALIACDTQVKSEDASVALEAAAPAASASSSAAPVVDAAPVVVDAGETSDVVVVDASSDAKK
jgi:hypothetical protein